MAKKQTKEQPEGQTEGENRETRKARETRKPKGETQTTQKKNSPYSLRGIEAQKKDPITHLNNKQEAFCRHFCNMSAETFDNATRSYIAAGYSERSAHTGGTELMRNYNVKNRIRALHEENLHESGVSAAGVINQIRYDRNQARKAGNWAAALSADRLEGQIIQLFVDKHVLTPTLPDQPEIAEEERRMLTEIAKTYKDKLALAEGLAFEQAVPNEIEREQIQAKLQLEQ